MKRKGTINHQFNQRIPADIKARAVGMTLHIPVGETTLPVNITDRMSAVRVSLRTGEPNRVKERQAQIAAYLEGVWRALRSDQPATLSHQQAHWLAGQFYLKATAAGLTPHGQTFDRPVVNGAVDTTAPLHVEPIEPEFLHAPPEALDGLLERVADPELDLEAQVGREVDRHLMDYGMREVDPASRHVLLTAFRSYLAKYLQLRQRQAAGDYSRDVTPEAIPAGVSLTKPTKPASNVSLTGLVDDWWKEAEAAGRTLSTYESYRNTAKRLNAFLKHDDAVAVTSADIVAFKDHRLAEGASPKTVGDSDIAGLRSIFKWAVGNLKLPSNPAQGIVVTRPKVTRLRERSFTPEEAKAILTHSLNHRKGRQGAKLLAAMRWVPWLCAYTGARVGEMVQLRKEDVRQQGDMWVITITPEAGTVKDKEVREVVLHAHLVDTGFTAFVTDAAEGPLFMAVSKTGTKRGAWRTVKNRV